MRIDDHMGLALNYAYKFSKGLPHMRREMISEALWILVEADRRFNDRHDNFVGYLKLCLRGGLTDFINNIEYLVSYEDHAPTTDDHMEFFLREIFATNLFTEEEQQLIRERLEGLTDQEIANRRKVSQTIINRRRQNICQKILKEGKQHGLERSKKSISKTC